MKRSTPTLAGLGALLGFFVASGPALPQTSAPLIRSSQDGISREALPDNYLVARLSGGITLDRYLQALHSEFARADADGNGTVDQNDVDFQNSVNSARLRAMSATRIMNADLDGDGMVTEAELRQLSQYEQRLIAAMQNKGTNPAAAKSAADRAEEEIRTQMGADADKDGRITWDEAIAFAKKQPAYAQTIASGASSSAHQLLAMVTDGKTAVTWPELETSATASFRRIDADGNGTISLDELDNARKAVSDAAAEASRQRQQQNVVAACDLPKASAAAKVILLSAYETEALSNVAIGSEDEVTGVGNINVEPGSDPLYVVIATYRPTIWRFYGAVERIERVVIAASRGPIGPNGALQPAAGAVGLPADRISFPTRPNCPNWFNEAPSIASAEAAGALKQATGKEVATISAIYKLTAFAVPSGKIEVIEKNRPQLLVIEKSGGNLVIDGDASQIRVQTSSGNLERELLTYNPGGVISVDAKQVVASLPVAPYDVLPEHAGLIQLVKSGALTQNRDGEFLINQKIRMPAGLSGSLAVKFLLRRGVPEPDGDPGHSKIISEETGQEVQMRKR